MQLSRGDRLSSAVPLTRQGDKRNIERWIKSMKPLKLAKALALSFALGAIFSIGSDPNITRQVQAIAQAQAQAIATSAMQSLGKTLGQWLDSALKGG
jgi:hypothetical protein